METWLKVLKSWKGQFHFVSCSLIPDPGDQLRKKKQKLFFLQIGLGRTMGSSDVVFSVFLSYLLLLTPFQQLHMAIHRGVCIINKILICCEKLFTSRKCISVDFHMLLNYQRVNQEPGLTNLFHVSLEGTGSTAAQLVKHISLMLLESFMQATMLKAKCSMNKIHLLAPRFKNIVVKIDSKGVVPIGSL